MGRLIHFIFILLFIYLFVISAVSVLCSFCRPSRSTGNPDTPAAGDVTGHQWVQIYSLTLISPLRHMIKHLWQKRNHTAAWNVSKLWSSVLELHFLPSSITKIKLIFIPQMIHINISQQTWGRWYRPKWNITLEIRVCLFLQFVSLFNWIDLIKLTLQRPFSAGHTGGAHLINDGSL